MKFKGAIFDLDGTILDSSNIWKMVDSKFFGMHEMSVPSDYLENISAMNIFDIARYTIKRFNFNYEVNELVDLWNSIAKKEYEENVLIKPYVKEYLLKLKSEGVKLGIATALDSFLYEPCLKRNGIFDIFDDHRSLSTMKNGKDSPDIYLFVAEKLGVKPNECMVFEDIAKGCKSAKSASFYVVGVNDSNNENIKKYTNKYIYSFKELL
ncbi:MAG: HAD family phosphatase [bacterium]|nr:HAD family phosphatase [bacterium]